MAATAAMATSASSRKSARAGGQAERGRAVGVEGDRRPGAPERERRRQRERHRRGGQGEVGGVEAEQRPEQQAVDRGAGLEDVAGQDDAAGERRHQQQRGRLARARGRARPARSTPPA